MKQINRNISKQEAEAAPDEMLWLRTPFCYFKMARDLATLATDALGSNGIEPHPTELIDAILYRSIANIKPPTITEIFRYHQHCLDNEQSLVPNAQPMNVAVRGIVEFILDLTMEKGQFVTEISNPLPKVPVAIHIERFADAIGSENVRRVQWIYGMKVADLYAIQQAWAPLARKTKTR